MTSKKNKEMHKEIVSNIQNQESDRLATNPTFDDFLEFVINKNMGFYDYDEVSGCYSWDLEYWNKETQQKFIAEANMHLDNWNNEKILPEGFVPAKVDPKAPKQQTVFKDPKQPVKFPKDNN